jgi:ribosomal protein L1
VTEGGTGVEVSKYPNGVSVAVDVALGSGVMLGKGVNVIVGVSVARNGTAVWVAVGTAVRVCAFPVWAKSGVSVTGTEAGAGKVTKQADVTSTIANASITKAFDLFIAHPAGS